MKETELMQLLSGLVGRKATIEGRSVCVIEILREGPLLVLRDLGAGMMQDNLYGQPRRRAARHFEVPLLSSVSHEPHPVTRQLLTDDETKRLTDLLGPSDGGSQDFNQPGT